MSEKNSTTRDPSMGASYHSSTVSNNSPRGHSRPKDTLASDFSASQSSMPFRHEITVEPSQHGFGFKVGDAVDKESGPHFPVTKEYMTQVSSDDGIQCTRFPCALHSSSTSEEVKPDSNDSLKSHRGVEDDTPMEILVEEINDFAVIQPYPSASMDSATSDPQLIPCTERRSSTGDPIGEAMKALLDIRNCSDLNNIREEDSQPLLSEVEYIEQLMATNTDRQNVLGSLPTQSDELLHRVENHSLAPIDIVGRDNPHATSVPKYVARATMFIGVSAITIFGLLVSWQGIRSIDKMNQLSLNPISGKKGVSKSVETIPLTMPDEVLDSTMDNDDSNRTDSRADTKSEVYANPLRKVDPTGFKRKRISKLNRSTNDQKGKIGISDGGSPVNINQILIPPLNPQGFHGLPQTPDREMIKKSLLALQPEVQKCAEGMNGVAEVEITIKNSGRVSHVMVTGDFQGKKQGSCIARVIRESRFDPFIRPSIRILYPFLL